jgi:hypothetical protein
MKLCIALREDFKEEEEKNGGKYSDMTHFLRLEQGNDQISPQF